MKPISKIQIELSHEQAIIVRSLIDMERARCCLTKTPPAYLDSLKEVTDKIQELLYGIENGGAK